VHADLLRVHVATARNATRMEHSTDSQRRLLLIDRQYPIDSVPHRNAQIILRGLQHSYRVDAHVQLDEHVPHLVLNAAHERLYDAIVTHLPFERSYAFSFMILAAIKHLADIPIVAYTGATASDIGWDDNGAPDAIVFKTSSAECDLATIKEHLGLFIAQKELPTQPLQPPTFRVEGASITVELTVGLNAGITPCVALQIFRRCRNFPGRAYAQALDSPEPDELLDLSDFMQVCMFAAAWPHRRAGARIKITLEADAEAAQILAQDLAKGLTSRWSDNCNFGLAE
jgi:hypothetical protein